MVFDLDLQGTEESGFLLLTLLPAPLFSLLSTSKVVDSPHTEPFNLQYCFFCHADTQDQPCMKDFMA